MAPAGRAMILLVDGESLVLDVERTFLRRSEVRIRAIGAGDDPVAIAAVERPDLMVLDLHAANRSGLSVCGRVRSDPRTARIPILLVSTLTFRREAERAGADAVIFKPLVKRELLDSVRRFVPLRERRGPRCPVSLRVAFAVAGRQAAHASSRDLSETGVLLESHRLPEIGTRLTLRFRLPGEEGEISCDGVVRRRQEPEEGAEGPVGFGVEFQALGDADRGRLESFVGQRLARPVALPDPFS